MDMKSTHTTRDITITQEAEYDVVGYACGSWDLPDPYKPSRNPNDGSHTIVYRAAKYLTRPIQHTEGSRAVAMAYDSFEKFRNADEKTIEMEFEAFPKSNGE